MSRIVAPPTWLIGLLMFALLMNGCAHQPAASSVSETNQPAPDSTKSDSPPADQPGTWDWVGKALLWGLAAVGVIAIIAALLTILVAIMIFAQVH